MALLPINIDMVQWTQQLQNEYPDERLPFLLDEKDWRKWVDSVILLNAFSAFAIPSSEMFSDFREWAMQFTLSIGE